MGDRKIAYEEASARREDQPPSPMKGRLHSDSHARIFGLSLAVVLAACLVLNATSPSTRLCQHSDRDFGSTKACATNQGGEEPGY
jgi:hypothetical protein